MKRSFILFLAAMALVAALATGVASGPASATAEAPASNAWIQGAVRDAVTSSGLDNILVVLDRLDVSNPKNPTWVQAGLGYTQLHSYAFEHLNPGSYRLQFSDSSGTYAPQHWNDKLSASTADAIALPTTTSQLYADVRLVKAGHITGKVTDAAGRPIPGITVGASSTDLKVDDLPVPEATTAADGTYDLGGLNSGNWVVEFTDLNNVYQYQFWPDKLVVGQGTAIAVTAGETATTLNATMKVPPAITKDRLLSQGRRPRDHQRRALRRHARRRKRVVRQESRGQLPLLE